MTGLKYLSKFPPKAQSMDVFYLRPVYHQKLEGPWYKCSPVGKKKIRKCIVIMCQDAGIIRRKTNHSLRETGVTALFIVLTFHKK